MGDVSKIKMPDNSIQNIKDKVARETIETKMPFYTIGTPTVLVDTTTVSFSKDGNNNWYISGENPISLSISSSDIENSIFFIEWDNVEYKLFLKIIQDMCPVRGVTGSGYFDWWAIGNVSTIGYGSILADIEAPFAVTMDYMKNAGERYIISYDTAASHTIKISKASFTKTVCDPAYYADTRKTGYPPIRFTSNRGSVAESGASKSSGSYSHAEGIATVASGNYSHAEGTGTKASADTAHAEGYTTTASGFPSHAEGYGTISSSTASHAEGLNTTASGYGSHAEGYGTISSNTASHAEGYNTTASSFVSHAEGQITTASGYGSHTEGQKTTASGTYSHAEGNGTTASGSVSHVEGEYTIANHRTQHVFGKANIEDSSTAEATIIGNYVEIVGNGTWETIEGETVITRSNARTLDWSGNEVLAGDLTYNGNTSLTSTISNINTDLSNKMDKTNPTGVIRATMESTSKATEFVLTAPNITSLYDGLTIVAKNTVVASASGCTIDLNGLGAKDIWLSQSNSACTTHWALNTTYIFIYDATNERWELQQGRDTDTDKNDIQTIRMYYTYFTAGSHGLMNRGLCAKLRDSDTYSSFTTTSGTGSKTYNTTDSFDLSKIYYCSQTSNIDVGDKNAANAINLSYPLVDLRYTLNGVTTKATSSVLTAKKPLYLLFDKDCKLCSPYFTQDIYNLDFDDASDWGVEYAVLIGITEDTYRMDLLMVNALYKVYSREWYIDPTYGDTHLIPTFKPEYCSSIEENKLVWTNSNPHASATITGTTTTVTSEYLPLYSKIRIDFFPVYAMYTAVPFYVDIPKSVNGSQAVMVFFNYAAKNGLRQLEITKLSDTSFKIDWYDGGRYDTYGTNTPTVADSWGIPYKIYLCN